ncbi:unnamed protein product [Candida verbasci]|uniref:Deacetylase sirtuin-type domain-containing protein n=1 Tax=Candida verbasci TaxID=1227364 RepID=A0A9W4TZL2_9ASCO|nr:unnamed protein product [Candida verbasci]
MITIDLNENLSSESSIQLNQVIKYIFKSKKTTILTGAGISCNAGIPDFRSDDGLYNMVKSKYPKALVKGQDLFDISLFRDSQSLSIFCTFMESLYNASLLAKPTETHKFIKTLKDKNKLLRCYTQNIDCLEKNMNLNLGLSSDSSNSSFKEDWKNFDVIQLHGNLHKLSCTNCFSNFNWNENFQKLLSDGLNPECSKCLENYEKRLYSGKRLTNNMIGMLRPDIVLYGENHPQSELLSQGLSSDLKLKPDLLIIMGTSLKVDGVKKLVKSLSNKIHEFKNSKNDGKVIFINKTPLSKQWEKFIDYEIISDCDDFVKILKKEIPDLFLTQEQIDSKKLKNKFNHVMIKQERKITKNPIIKKEKIKRKQEKGNTTVKQQHNEINIKIEDSDDVQFESEVFTNGDETDEDIKDNILTPPITPTKKRRPTLKRKRPQQQKQQQNKRLKRPPSKGLTPPSSFSEDLPLKCLTTSQMNQMIQVGSSNVKAESISV